jgi:hypothetical protein
MLPKLRLQSSVQALYRRTHQYFNQYFSVSRIHWTSGINTYTAMADVSMKSANEAEFERFSSPKTCPSCGQKSFRHSVFRKHIHRCCPDLLMVSKHTHSADGTAHFESERDVEEWLRVARAKELELHKKAVRDLQW